MNSTFVGAGVLLVLALPVTRWPQKLKIEIRTHSPNRIVCERQAVFACLQKYLQI